MSRLACGGSRYTARFLDAGVEYTPILGAAEAVDRTLRFSLLTVGRGADARPVDAPWTRDVTDLAVRFRRHGVEEAGGKYLERTLAGGAKSRGKLAVLFGAAPVVDALNEIIRFS